jgi:hypothetical protein
LGSKRKDLANIDSQGLLHFSAQDWIRTNAGYQLFIDYVCQVCVVKSERAKKCAGSSYFFSVSTYQSKYRISFDFFGFIQHDK